MARVELVIFDCDGVLVDSEAISNTVLAAMLDEAGLPTTAGQARAAYQGMLLQDIVAEAEGRLGRRLPAGWLAEFERTRAQAFQAQLAPVDGAAGVVEEITSAGVAVCVASQGKLEKTALSLQLAGLDHLFPAEARFSAYQVPRGKPHPDVFLHAAASIGALPSACMVIEDSVSGIQAAHDAGMTAIAYAASPTEADMLRETGALVIASLAELPGQLRLS